MNIQLMHGHFSKADSLDLITQMIHVKIRYHENRIKTCSNEEDTKMRETKIKRLQKDLYDLKNFLNANNDVVSITSLIEIE